MTLVMQGARLRRGRDKMQSNLQALFKGKVEAVELPKKRSVGRPKGSCKKPSEPLLEAPPDLEDEVRALKRRRIAEMNEEVRQLVMRSATTDQAGVEAIAEEPLPLQDVEGTPDLAQDASSLVLAEASTRRSMRPSREQCVEYGKLGAAFGRLGGRPRKAQTSEALATLSSTQGAKRLRDESFGPHAKLRLCGLVEKTAKETGESLEVVVANLSRRLGRASAQIWKALEGKAKWVAIVGAAGFTVTGLSRMEAHLPKYLRTRRFSKNGSHVVRASGAGRKSDVEFLYPAVVEWFEDLRMGGHYVDKADLVIEFIRVATMYLERLKSKAEDTELKLSEKQRMFAIEVRIEALQKRHARRYMANTLQRFSGARFLKPQRVMNLTPLEEKSRAEATWQNYDQVLHGVMNCEGKFLRSRFANPDQVNQNVRHTVLLFSDQIPVWIKIVPGRQLYAKGEVRKKSEKVAPEATMLQMTGQPMMSQRVVEQPSQHRGQGHAEQERYRITYEACQAVFNYFDEEQEPRGAIVRSSIILSGSHARLHNLDDNGCFLADEAFVVKGKPVLRKAGSNSRGLLKAWVELRRTSAEARRMLEDVDVYQQPAGFADSVVTSWITERSSEVHVQAIHQRDLFAGALSEAAKRASWLGHQATTWVAGKMTAVLQLTDTEVAYPLKSAVLRSKDVMKREMRNTGEASGKVANFVCGPFQVLRLIHEAHMHTVSCNLKTNFVLAGLRRNGMLSWRPSLSQMKLVRSDGQAWAQQLPEGSHRYPSEWLKDRYSWLDEHGTPCEPRWNSCGVGVKAPEDMEDHCYHGEEGAVVKLASTAETHPEGFAEASLVIDCDEEKLDCKLAHELFEASKAERIKAHVDEVLKEEPGKAKKKHQRRMKRLQSRRAMRSALREWRLEQRELLAKYSRKQLLKALVPEAGVSKSRKQAKLEEGVSKKKVKDWRGHLLRSVATRELIFR